jgi:ABC-type dipeptide/oligopeptide/nickel transport system ATPase component
MKPDLVLADEPTGNLDTKSANNEFELMRQVNQDSGISLLPVTHNLDLAAAATASSKWLTAAFKVVEAMHSQNARAFRAIPILPVLEYVAPWEWPLLAQSGRSRLEVSRDR